MTGSDRYQIIGRLGAGGYGVVYLARHTRSLVGYERLVAIKVLASEHATPSALERFRHEARLLGRIRHSAVVRGGPPLWLAPIEPDGRPPAAAFIMEYVAGAPLSRWTDAGVAVPPAVALAIVARVAAVMHQIYFQEEDGRALGVVHRDLKPSNVMLGRGGDVFILDVGIARANLAFIHDRSATIGLVGTPGYIAPERHGRGDTGPASAGDVYALGVILHELICGRHPDLGGAPPTTGLTGDALALAARMRAPLPSDRPTWRETTHAAEALIPPGAPLAAFAEQVVPSAPALTHDAWTGSTLFEVAGPTSRADTAPPAPTLPLREPTPRPPPRPWPLLAAAAAATVALSAAAWWSAPDPAAPADAPVAPPREVPTVHTEPAVAFAGRHRAVVQVGPCAAVILAPHMLVAHGTCHPLPSPLRLATRDGVIRELALGDAVRSPFRRSMTANPPDADGPTDEHDELLVLYVPDLTATLLGELGILPPRVDPFVSFTTAEAVSLTEDGSRTWMTTSFPEGASDLAHHVLRACAGELCPARHSFGGPTVGVTPWLRRFTAHGELEPPLPAQPDGPSAWGDTVLVGVAAPGAARPGSPADTAELTPLAVFDTMTEDQRATAFANTAWLRLMIADVDRDGAPDRCADGACSPWFGVPQAADGVGARGLLACPTGYVATGIRGQNGSLVDAVSLQCMPAACVAAGRGRCHEVWTEPFGGANGEPYTSTCTYGDVITSIRGSVSTAVGHWTANWVRSIEIGCAPLDGLRQGRPAPSPRAPGWWEADSVAAPFTAACGEGTAAVGLTVGGVQPGLLSGAQLVCAREPVTTSVFAGQRAHPDQPLRCQDGAEAIGLVAAETKWNVGLFGLICGSRDGAAQPFVIHPSFEDSELGVHGPNRTTLEAFERAPPNRARIARCAPGGTLREVEVRDGKIITRLEAMTCVDRDGVRTRHPLEVGQGTDPRVTLRCDGPVVGVVPSATGWLEGIALTCGEAPRRR